MAVTGRTSKIADRGVFAVTCISSLWAYIWLLIVLVVWTPDHVSLIEAIMTVLFFVILILSAFGADRYTASQMKKLQTNDDKKEEFDQQKMLSAKDKLVEFVDSGKWGKDYLLKVAYGA